MKIWKKMLEKEEKLQSYLENKLKIEIGKLGKK